MCTAVSHLTQGLYFGRDLDYEVSFGESVTITPRSFPFRLRHLGAMDRHYAMIGMAHVLDDYPLYYDAMNEKGLCIAGLNFVTSAVYQPPMPDRDNVAQFELIPWLLGRCATAAQARALLEHANITDEPFCEGLPLARLHWLIADRHETIVLEATADGLHIYDDPVGVLTNEPPFPMQMFALNDHARLSPDSPQPLFAGRVPLQTYSRGLGGLGLPGDLSSRSRFVRAAFVNLSSRSGESEEESVSQFFHILTSVEQQRGCCRLDGDKYEFTLYSSCCSADRGIYYYTTYENRQITAVDMKRENLDGAALVSYPLVQGQQIRWAN